MNVLDISKYKIIHDIPPVLTSKDRCAIDTEFTGMDGNRLHRPSGEFACVTFYFGGEEVYIVENLRDLSQAFENIEASGWIFHNAKFDITQLRRYVRVEQRKRIWDTQIVDQVRFSGRFSSFRLSDLCRRYLDIYVEKGTREEFESHTGEMTQRQVEYACADPILTYLVFLCQRSEIDDDDLKVWQEIERPFMWSVLSKSGMPLDVPSWLELAEKNERLVTEIQSRYGKAVPKIGKKGQPLKSMTFEGTNLASPKQVKEHLLSLGFDIPGTGVKELIPIADKSEFIRDLLEYRKYSKRATTYGTMFVEKYVEADGKVYPDIFQREAETSRSSSRSPNGQQIPSRDTKDYRKCFIASDGMVLIDADYSSQEPRVAAQLSGDENLIKVFHSGKDIYVAVADLAFGEIIEKSDPKRKKYKDLTLGVFYGKTKWGLSRDLGIELEEAEEMIERFFLAFPKVKRNYVDAYQRFAQENGYVKTISGSKLWVNLYSSQWERNAINSPIQGTSAEMLKKATHCFLEKWHGKNYYTNTAFLLPIHDEILLEVPKEDAEEARELLENIMIQVAEEFHPLVPSSVEAHIINDWSEK